MATAPPEASGRVSPTDGGATAAPRGRSTSRFTRAARSACRRIARWRTNRSGIWWRTSGRCRTRPTTRRSTAPPGARGRLADEIPRSLGRRGPILPDVHRDPPPLALIEPEHAEGAARHVPGQDRDPDVQRLERPGLPDDEADPERNRDLRDDGDVERAPRVSRPLQPSRVGERDGDEEPGHAQDVQELGADLDHRRLVQPEDGEQLARKEEKEDADGRRRPRPDPRGDVHRLLRPVRMTGAEG